VANCTLFRLWLTTIAVGLAATNTAQGQTLSFLRQFSAPKINEASAVAADPSGIYVGSSRQSCNTTVAQCRADVIKYDHAGNELWTREFTADGFPRPVLTHVMPSATGIYVSAWNYETRSFLLRKYSLGGEELWTRPLTFFSWRGLAADATGVYVAGEESFPGIFATGTFSYLRKYSPQGNELWTARYDASRGGVTGIAPEATGNVYVMNLHGAAGPPVRTAGVIVRKYDVGGQELWARELIESDFPRTMAAAKPTGFYLIAADALRGGTFLRNYDADAKELWSRRLDSFSEHIDSKIASDSTGVYLAGGMPMGYSPFRPWINLPGQCRSGSGGDFFVRKYNLSGEPVWERQLGTSQATGAMGLALHSDSVYVVGGVSGAAFLDQWELAPAEILAAVDPPRAFVAKFDQLPVVGTGSGPRIFAECVVNAASFLGGGVAPGEIVTIFGSALGPAELVHQVVGENGRLGTTLADTRVLFNGTPAPVVYVSDKQTTAIVPFATRDRSSVEVQVEYKGIRSNVVTLPVLRSRPGIFSLNGSGEGQGAIVNEDGTINSPSNPARRGSIVSLYVTGGGEAATGLADGEIVTNILPRPALPVSVFFDLGNNEYQVNARRGEVLYVGGVPGSVVGLLQINVRVPSDAVTVGPAVPFALFIGSHWTMFQVTMALR
jgi:uncharacterized protein (TIGR03437 family)